METQTNKNEVEAVVQEHYHEWILRQMRKYRMVKCPHCGVVRTYDWILQQYRRMVKCPHCGVIMYDPHFIIIPGGADRTHPSQWRKDYADDNL